MILFNHLDLVCYTILASVVSGIFIKIYMENQSLIKATIIFLYLPIFIVTYPVYHFTQIYKYRSDMLRILKKAEISEEKKRKVRKSLSSKRSIAFHVLKSLVLNFRLLLDVYIEVSAESYDTILGKSLDEMKKAVFDDTKDTYIWAI